MKVLNFTDCFIKNSLSLRGFFNSTIIQIKMPNQKWLNTHKTDLPPRPSNSPGLIPTENLWDELERKEQHRRPRTLDNTGIALCVYYNVKCSRRNIVQLAKIIGSMDKVL